MLTPTHSGITTAPTGEPNPMTAVAAPPTSTADSEEPVF